MEVPRLRHVSSFECALGWEVRRESRSEERMAAEMVARVLERKTPWVALDLRRRRARDSRVLRCVSRVSRM